MKIAPIVTEEVTLKLGESTSSSLSVKVSSLYPDRGIALITRSVFLATFVPVRSSTPADVNTFNIPYSGSCIVIYAMLQPVPSPS